MAASPQHATLVGGAVTTMTFDLDFAGVEVTNVSGAAAVYFTTNGTTPVAAATGTYVLAALAGQKLDVDAPAGEPTLVKLISSGTPTVSARGTR